jgi:hypothetical protein
MHRDDGIEGFAEPLQQPRGETDFHLDLHERKALGHPGKEPWQDLGAIILHDPDANASGRFLTGNPHDRLLVQRENAPRVDQEAVGSSREFDASRRPAKQHHTDALFETPDLQADGGLRAVELRGGTGERQVLGNGDEGAQEFGVEAESAHNQTLSSSLRLFDSLLNVPAVSMGADRE